MKSTKALKRFVAAVVFTCGCSGTVSAQAKWVATWAVSPEADADEAAFEADELRFGTLRQIVHLSLGGTRLRVRLSNRYGEGPLHVLAVHLAKGAAAGSSKIVSGTDKAVLFSGKAEVIVPQGADYFSDPIDFRVPALSDLAITLRVDPAFKKLTGHPGSRATSFLATGDALSADELSDAKKITRWYFIAGVDVEASANAFAIVA